MPIYWEDDENIMTLMERSIGSCEGTIYDQNERIKELEASIDHYKNLVEREERHKADLLVLKRLLESAHISQ